MSDIADSILDGVDQHELYEHININGLREQSLHHYNHTPHSTTIRKPPIGDPADPYVMAILNRQSPPDGSE